MDEFRSEQTSLKPSFYPFSSRSLVWNQVLLPHEEINVIAHNDFVKEAKLWGSMGQSALIRAAAMYGLFLFDDSMRVPWVTADPSVSAAN